MIDGAMRASISTFEQMYITPNEYYDYVPLIVHRKCF